MSEDVIKIETLDYCCIHSHKQKPDKAVEPAKQGTRPDKAVIRGPTTHTRRTHGPTARR